MFHFSLTVILAVHDTSQDWQENQRGRFRSPCLLSGISSLQAPLKFVWIFFLLSDSLSASRSLRRTRCLKTRWLKAGKSVRICHESWEIWENCDPRRKPGDGDNKKKWESSEKNGRVGKYANRSHQSRSSSSFQLNVKWSWNDHPCPEQPPKKS